MATPPYSLLFLFVNIPFTGCHIAASEVIENMKVTAARISAAIIVIISIGPAWLVSFVVVLLDVVSIPKIASSSGTAIKPQQNPMNISVAKLTRQLRANLGFGFWSAFPFVSLYLLVRTKIKSITHHKPKPPNVTSWIKPTST